MTIEQHGIYKMTQVDMSEMTMCIICVEKVGNIFEAITAGIEQMTDNAFFYDVGYVLHVVDSDVAFVARVDEIEIFKGKDGYAVFGMCISPEIAVGILDEYRTTDFQSSSL